MQVGVGRLGVITEVELMIKPQTMVQRELVLITWQEFREQLEQLQSDWNAAVAGTDGLTKFEALDAWEGVQVRNLLTQ